MKLQNFFVLKFLCLYSYFLQKSYAQVYHVLNFNATGDGKTDDTQAVRAALAAAYQTNGGRVVFDSGYTFLTGPFNLSSNIILDIQGTILASLNISDYPIISIPIWDGEGVGKQPIIFVVSANNITLTGGGTIDGQGSYWYACQFNASAWPCSETGRPQTFQPRYTDNIVIENIHIKDSPSWNIHLCWTTNVYINNITITSPAGPLITEGMGLENDGIDIACSVNVTVENSYISNADDAVVIKSGMNNHGRIYRVCQNKRSTHVKIDDSA